MARARGPLRGRVSRVVLVTPYALSAFGGVQEQALGMSRELTRRGHDVHLVSPDASDTRAYDTPATIHRFGARIPIPANGSRAPLTLSPRAAARAARLVERLSPHVVHLHEPFAPLLGYDILRARSAPLVGTFHRSGGGPAVRWTRPVLRVLGHRLDEATAVSEAAATTMGTAAGRTCEILFNGFETDRFSAIERRTPASPTLLVVGRLEERKGVATAVDALRHHNATASQPWRLVVLGDGPLRPALESRAANDDVVFLGAVDEATKLRWLRSASVLVAPALRGESFGLVLLEAMAAELPVVASDIDGYRTAAGGHAILANPGDPVELAKGVDRALDRSPAALAAARRHAEGWSMASLVDRYEEIYERARGRWGVAR